MFRIVLIISTFIYVFKCCDVLEEKLYGHEMGMSWNYLVNVTDLARGAYIGNVEKINISLTGIFLLNNIPTFYPCPLSIKEGMTNDYINMHVYISPQKRVVMPTTMRL